MRSRILALPWIISSLRDVAETVAAAREKCSICRKPRSGRARVGGRRWTLLAVPFAIALVAVPAARADAAPEPVAPFVYAGVACGSEAGPWFPYFAAHAYGLPPNSDVPLVAFAIEVDGQPIRVSHAPFVLQSDGNGELITGAGVELPERPDPDHWKVVWTFASDAVTATGSAPIACDSAHPFTPFPQHPEDCRHEGYVLYFLAGSECVHYVNGAREHGPS